MANNTDNSYSECVTFQPVELPYVYRKILCLIYWANAPLTVTTNLLLIFALWRTNQLGNTTIKLLVAVSCSDTCGGILAFPLLGLTLVTTESRLNCIIKNAAQYIAVACCVCSLYTFVLVAVNRYLQLRGPNIITSSFRLTIALTGNIVLANVTSTMALLYSSFYSFLISNIFWCSLYSSIFLIYSSLLKQVRVHTDRSHAECNSRQRTSPDQNRGNNLANQSHINSTAAGNKTFPRSIQLLVGLLIVPSLPYNIISLVWSYYDNPGLYLNILQHVALIIALMNMSANAILFCHLNNGTRIYLRRLLLRF